MNQNELMHYGVLGMKWGVRKYQNKDGSLTAAGKEHYGIKGKNIKSDNRKIAKAKYEYKSQKAFEKYENDIKNLEKNYNKLENLSDEDEKKELAIEERYAKEQADLKEEYLSTWAKNTSAGAIVGNAILKSVSTDVAGILTNLATGGVLSSGVNAVNSIVNTGIAAEMVVDLVRYSKYK